MDIYEALEKLSGFFEALTNYGEYSDEELELMAEVEDTIYQFARKYEPQRETKYDPETGLPLEFTCSCGRRLFRHDIVMKQSRFFCVECESAWLVGPQEG